MKGLVFTEFLEMVETRFGYRLVDRLLTENDLPSGGIYTTVGTYDHTEMLALLNGLSQHTQTPVSDLLRTYGRYLFGKLTKNYRHFMDHADSTFGLLTSIQHHIHVEVRKLYPDAELPQFTIEKSTADQLIMRYESERKLADFAYGLIEGCLDYFGEKAEIMQTNLVADGSVVRFTIVKQ